MNNEGKSNTKILIILFILFFCPTIVVLLVGVYFVLPILLIGFGCVIYFVYIQPKLKEKTETDTRFDESRSNMYAIISGIGLVILFANCIRSMIIRDSVSVFGCVFMASIAGLALMFIIRKSNWVFIFPLCGFSAYNIYYSLRQIFDVHQVYNITEFCSYIVFFVFVLFYLLPGVRVSTKTGDFSLLSGVLYFISVILRFIKLRFIYQEFSSLLWYWSTGIAESLAMLFACLWFREIEKNNDIGRDNR